MVAAILVNLEVLARRGPGSSLGVRSRVEHDQERRRVVAENAVVVENGVRQPANGLSGVETRVALLAQEYDKTLLAAGSVREERRG